jgi:hypothetical protein
MSGPLFHFMQIQTTEKTCRLSTEQGFGFRTN